MGYLLFVAAIFFIIALLLFFVTSKNNVDGAVPWPFYARKPLSLSEIVLYFRLRKALPGHIVLSQVALSRILGVKRGNNFGKWFNRINRMSVDFVLCRKDGTIVAVIELDDASHEKPERRIADAKKDKALTAAGIQILRWKPNSIPDDVSIKVEFANGLADVGSAASARRVAEGGGGASVSHIGGALS